MTIKEKFSPLKVKYKVFRRVICWSANFLFCNIDDVKYTKAIRLKHNIHFCLGVQVYLDGKVFGILNVRNP